MPANTATESTPLIHPNTTVTTINGPPETSRRAVSQLPIQGVSLPASGAPKLWALNDKLRRRNSHGHSYTPIQAPALPSTSKIGPQRTTKTAQKLKILPNPDVGEDGPDEESGRDVYSQFTRIKDPTARRDAARLGKADRDRLPRVTAYCTASAYRLDGLMKFLKGRGRTRGASPKLYDECIYTPYQYSPTADKIPNGVGEATRSRASLHERRYSDSMVQSGHEDGYRRQQIDSTDVIVEEEEPLVAQHDEDHSGGYKNIDRERHERHESPRGQDSALDTVVHTPEVFLFDYGTVVIWGMSVAEEQRFLQEISKFEKEKLAPEDVQTENFNFYYTNEYQARIYNDFISLRDKKNYMVKLAISHALSQSVKTSLFEDLVDNTIEATKDVPERIARTGNVNLSRRQILMQVGELFILRINIHLQGSVLDSPELMWAEPQLDPVYQAVRSYLEMDQRVGLLTERLDVIADLLTVLKDQLAHTHGEYLEWIVIVLIAAEILVAAVNIIVDLYFGMNGA
ncbi:MAG: hypothetical protein M1823_002685 [Watsoniomyces obsoletus]|nr:MAG: hypothetical protein M1823_002685 [Watsoniomyces obsoletus]